jgi:hypothetical protein
MNCVTFRHPPDFVPTCFVRNDAHATVAAWIHPYVRRLRR